MLIFHLKNLFYVTNYFLRMMTLKEQEISSQMVLSPCFNDPKVDGPQFPAEFQTVQTLSGHFQFLAKQQRRRLCKYLRKFLT